MRKSRFLKAEIIVLVCVAALWAVDLKTACVPRATAGALQQVVKVTPNSERTFRLLATMSYHSGQEEAGDKAAAQAIIIELRDADPNDAEALYDLAQAYFDVGRYEDAVEAYRKAIEIEPYCICSPYYGFITHFNFAYAYETLGDLQSAVRTYERGLSLDPECRDARARLAYDYDALGMYEPAIAEWRELIEREPNVPIAYTLLAGVYLEAGRYTEAVTACTRALEVQPDNDWAHYSLGRVYLQMGDIDSALKEFVVLYTLKPGSELALDLATKVRYVLRQMIIANDVEMARRKLLQMQHEALTELRTKAAVQKRKLDAISAMVTEGTISTAEGELKSCDVLSETDTICDALDRNRELKRQAFWEERKARPDSWADEAVGAAWVDISQRIVEGVPLPSFCFLERSGKPRPQGDPTPAVSTVIVMVDNRLCAVIKNRFVYANDSVDGYRVKAVRSDNVEFEKDGQTWVQKVQ